VRTGEPQTSGRAARKMVTITATGLPEADQRHAAHLARAPPAVPAGSQPPEMQGASRSMADFDVSSSSVETPPKSRSKSWSALAAARVSASALRGRTNAEIADGATQAGEQRRQHDSVCVIDGAWGGAAFPGRGFRPGRHNATRNGRNAHTSP